MIPSSCDSWSVSMNDESAPRRARRSRLVVGIFLLLLGALLLAVNLGYSLPWGWWQYLPWLLIGVGGWGLLVPSRHLDRSGGVWLLATGMYFLIGMHDLWGLGWGGGWPVFVIAAGLAFILHRHDDVPPTGRDSAGGPAGRGVP
jgi:hypothetical protein